jgi:hypothetical protein
MIDEDEDHMVWQVRHSDQATCTGNRTADKAERERKAAWQKRLHALCATIQAGERPVGDYILHGETIYDTMNIYGGGVMIVATADGFLWCVQNNGMDGDNWSHNNVRTGGAGAIGWRLPATDELIAEARWIAGETA